MMSPLPRYTRRLVITCSLHNLIVVRSMSVPSQSYPYSPPSWAKDCFNCPPTSGRLRLANLPTPLYQIVYSDTSPHNDFLHTLQSLQVNFFIKRDDSSGGVELSGNKVRKLEFLLADALAQRADSVVTIGGVQSNHCRATAAAARMVQLESHLILRTGKRTSDTDVMTNDPNDVGLVGNLLMDRMVGSSIYTCTAGEYGRLGSKELLSRLAAHLKKQGKRPYMIPVGGSNGLGSWGYIQAVDELVHQWNAIEPRLASLDHIVLACGSGGTACGIVLGVALAFSSLNTQIPHVHAVGVCDDPDYFYKFVAGIADDMGFHAPDSMTTEDFVRRYMTVHQGKGAGYALATPAELDFTASFAQATGVVLDPVYSGKALFKFMMEVNRNPALYRSRNVLFWHTGGALGLYDKADDLASRLRASSSCTKLDVYGKGAGLNISQPSNSK